MPTEPLTLSPEFCLQRQFRVRQRLEQLSLDCALLISRENIQYVTGYRPPALFQAAVCLDRDGRCTLSAVASAEREATCDELRPFEAQWHSTLRQDQQTAAIQALSDSVGPLRGKRIGVEGNTCPFPFIEAGRREEDTFVDIESEIWQLRRRKDPDEMELIRRAVACTEAMYERAREVISPGITELEVYSELHAAAVQVAGEPLTGFGNDFQCCSPGGPPRERAVQEGELYILDLGPAYRGYFADNCRTIAVNKDPTDEQFAAWEAIVHVLEMVEKTVRPGVSCRELFQKSQAMLDEFQSDAFFHHLGHGFGLFPHEAPHLNPNWDETFLEGDCFTAEPGLYFDSLRAGIRLEQNYRVTNTGVERLTNFELDL